MPDEIDEMLRSEGIFQQRKAKKEDTDEKQSEPLEDSVLDWLEEYGDRQHGYAVREIRMLRAEVADLKERLDTAWGDVSAMQGIIDRVTAENAVLKAQRDEADAECREANASWCREIEECIDLNRELASMREQRDALAAENAALKAKKEER
jgi:FtsZ-binding cell division protein ZapB